MKILDYNVSPFASMSAECIKTSDDTIQLVIEGSIYVLFERNVQNPEESGTKKYTIKEYKQAMLININEVPNNLNEFIKEILEFYISHKIQLPFYPVIDFNKSIPSFVTEHREYDCNNVSEVAKNIQTIYGYIPLHHYYKPLKNKNGKIVFPPTQLDPENDVNPKTLIVDDLLPPLQAKRDYMHTYIVKDTKRYHISRKLRNIDFWLFND